jgi:23S rRNA pseudouridine1911/1915/1917 synthase
MLEKIHKIFIIPVTYAGFRLDRALSILLSEYSRTQILHWLKAGKVLINNHPPIKPGLKLKGEETISIEIESPARKEEWIPQAIPLSIAYEDDDLLIINKPVGMVVHPGAGNQNHTLLNALLHYAPHLHILPRAGIIHRLDKDTSGLLMVAKTPAAFKYLSEELKQRNIVREYKAVVYGCLLSGGTVNAPIARHPLQRKRMSIIETGKAAVTHYRVIEKYRAHTLLKLRLETGRTHQIRVHMSHVHHPIVGDMTYGGRVKLSKGMHAHTIETLRGFQRQALHAFSIGLTHPHTKQWLQVDSPLPEDMTNLIKVLREDACIIK